mmetsp:Transcript_24226/g.54481  ORF Transcript_24226/g.54481 Transcript_24226/m.54481 type:complete len:290 (-) Transcript_24226:412-1281(-)
MHLGGLVAIAPRVPLGHGDGKLCPRRDRELVGRAGPPQVPLVRAASAVESSFPPAPEELLRPGGRESDADEQHVEVLAEVGKQHPEGPVVLGDVVEHPVRRVRVLFSQPFPLRREICPSPRPLLPPPGVPNLQEAQIAVLLQVDDAVGVALENPAIAFLVPSLSLVDGETAAAEAVLLHPQLELLPQEPVLTLIPRLRVQQVDQVRISTGQVLECEGHRPCLEVAVASPVYLRVRLLDQHHPDLAHVLAASIQRLSARAAGDAIVDGDVLPPAVLVEPDGVDPLGPELC